jgi:ribose transport system ATP-binding protein
MTTTPPAATSSHGLATPLLHARGITKRYGGTLALDRAELKIGPGEIHGLLGENGSGKSTLIKILAGVVAPDAGQLSLFGDAIDLPLRPGEAHRRGIRFVHQNLGLIPSMTVGENLLIERFALARNSAFISWRHFYDDATRLLSQYELDLSPRQQLADLAPINRSLVAIVRAMAADSQLGGATEPRLLVLDEPTVFLPRGEVTRVFAMLRSLVSTGVGVLFVSHRMDEVREHTDRVTVLRDGSNAGTETTASVNDDALVRMIVGRDIAARAPDHLDPPAQPGVALELTGFRSRTLRDISLSVAPGEILGLTGLAGSGYEEVIYSLFGAHPSATGRMVVDGTPMALRALTPRTAIQAGIALIPADRMRDGLAGVATLEENVTLNVVSSYFRRMLLRRPELRRTAEQLVRDFRIRPANTSLPMENFSGGNQQRVLLAKWLARKPRILLLHEPTQGVDVGARADISVFLEELAGAGASIICASAEYEQLATLCTRVIIVADGRLQAELSGSALTKDRILAECLRGSSNGKSVAKGQSLHDSS